jgi:hypothetical protein
MGVARPQPYRAGVARTVLGREYPGVEVLNGKKYTSRHSGRVGGDTSFNMGTGADALISLLAKPETVPKRFDL